MTVLSSCGGLLKSGIISGSWLSEPWAAKVVTGQVWLVVSSVGSLAGLGGCFERKGEKNCKQNDLLSVLLQWKVGFTKMEKF